MIAREEKKEAKIEERQVDDVARTVEKGRTRTAVMRGLLATLGTEPRAAIF